MLYLISLSVYLSIFNSPFISLYFISISSPVRHFFHLSVCFITFSQSSLTSLYLYLFTCLCLCLSSLLCVSLLCLSVCISASPHAYVCTSACLTVHLFFSLSVHPYCMSACLSVSHSFHPSVCLSIYLSLCMSARRCSCLYGSSEMREGSV